MKRQSRKEHGDASRKNQDPAGMADRKNGQGERRGRDERDQQDEEEDTPPRLFGLLLAREKKHTNKETDC